MSKQDVIEVQGVLKEALPNAKFQVELVIKLADALPDMGRLHGQVLIVIKSYFHRYPFSLLFGRMAQHGAVPHAGT